MANHQRQFVDAEVKQNFHMPRQQRLAVETEQRLGKAMVFVTEKASADTRREHDNFHQRPFSPVSFRGGIHKQPPTL